MERPATGVLLTGGAGRRMGRPKAEVLVAGVPLAARGVALLGARCDRVVVVTRPEVALPHLVDVTVVEDPPGPAAGPLPAIAAGLAAASTPWVVVLAVDLPLAGPAVDALLVAGPPAVALDDDGRPQPLCCLLDRAAALGAVGRLLVAGERRAVALVEVLGALPVATPAGSLIGANTRAELAALSERLSCS